MNHWESPAFIWDEPAVADEVRPASATARPVPGEAGVWIFILGDLSIFGAIFIAFARSAHHERARFVVDAHQLHPIIGALNAVILLTSSWCVAEALLRSRGGATQARSRWLWAATACAAGFVALKAFEWNLELGSGHTPATSTFFTYYYVLCGIHLLHVVIGTGLITLWRRSTKNGLFAECAALYWHMVDLLWILIFAVVYIAVPA